MKILGFLLHYARSYWRWAVLALGATVIYAASTVILIQLLEPIFSEVLQIGSSEMPGGLGALLPADGELAAAPATPDGRRRRPLPARPPRLRHPTARPMSSRRRRRRGSSSTGCCTTDSNPSRRPSTSRLRR